VTLVVDASVACKWLLAETGADHAEALLTGGSLLVAPDLIVAEVCNVACLKLRRREIAADQAAAIVDGLPDLLDNWYRRHCSHLVRLPLQVPCRIRPTTVSTWHWLNGVGCGL
jgi:predicted nucleic acid-binding protein